MARTIDTIAKGTPLALIKEYPLNSQLSHN